MLEIIILIIFLISLAGVIFIVVRKIPVLVTLPQNGSTGIKKHKFILDLEEKIKEFALAFERQIYLHKALSWIKRITLKVEVKIDHLLHGIRKKAQQIDKEIKSKK